MSLPKAIALWGGMNMNDGGAATRRDNKLDDQRDTEVAWLDHAGVIVRVNDAWVEYGRKCGAAEPVGVGQNWLSVCLADPADHSRRTAEAMRACLGGTPVSKVLVPCHAPETPEWFEITFEALPDGDIAARVSLELLQLPEDTPRPRDLSTSHGLVGSFCDEQVMQDGATPDHEACPGWWADAEQTDGWVCACPCHEARNGWPAWNPDA